MTPKQSAFVSEYLIDLNATQAAIRAGYSEKNAHKIGSQLLGKTRISEAILKAKEKRSKKTEIDAEYVLNRLSDIDNMDVTDILNDDWTLKPLSEWPKVWRTYLSAFDVQEIRTGQSEGDNTIGLLKKIKWPDKVKILELIGKHVYVSAWDKQDKGQQPAENMAELISKLIDRLPN